MEYDSETLKCALGPLFDSAAILSLAGEIDLDTADTVAHCFRLLAAEEPTEV